MLSASINLPKPAGHALIVAGEASRVGARRSLVKLGYEVDERDDPYAAMLELCRRPLVFRAVIISLQSLYRDELSMISTIRRRFPHISIWLTNTDGRQAALAEAMRLGAEALLADDGVHPFVEPPAYAPAPPTQFRPVPVVPDAHPEPERAPTRTVNAPPSEPVLTADELRALLGEEN